MPSRRLCYMLSYDATRRSNLIINKQEAFRDCVSFELVSSVSNVFEHLFFISIHKLELLIKYVMSFNAIFSPPRNREGVTFSLQFVYVCVCVSVCLCLTACEQNPAKRIHRFGRSFH